MTIKQLALKHVTSHGMSDTEAAAMLEEFSKGEGRDIPWDKDVTTLPHYNRELPAPLIHRLDTKALGWMMRPRDPEAA